jgi:hypothetical protein
MNIGDVTGNGKTIFCGKGKWRRVNRLPHPPGVPEVPTQSA